MNIQGQGQVQSLGGGSNFMQNPAAASYQRNIAGMEPELDRARKFIVDKIFEFFMKRHKQSRETPPKKMVDLVRRLEECLFKTAATKEEYMNLATLENRLYILIRRLPLSNQNQQVSHLNSSSSIGTMIPTPGMPQNGNSGMMTTSPMDNSVVSGNYNNIASSMVNAGNILPLANGPGGGVNGGPFNSSHGPLANGYQHLPSSPSVHPSENNMVTSMGAQRMASQMIPTPGFSNTNNENAKSRSHINMEPSNNIDAVSNIDPMLVSQPLQQKQHAGGQNSRILHNLGAHMGGGIRSALQQHSYGLPNGAPKGALGMTGNNSQLVNGSGVSEDYLKANIYGNSPKTFDQHQQPLLQGDGYRASIANCSGSANLYIPGTSPGSSMNNQNLSTANAPSVSKRNSPLVTSKSNLNLQNSQEVINRRPHNPSEKMNFTSQHLSGDNLVQPHQRQQFDQQSRRFQQELLVDHQPEQKQQIQQHQHLFGNHAFGSSQASSELRNQLKTEPEMELPGESLHSQVSEQFQFATMQTHFSHNLVDAPSRGSQLVSLPSGPQDFYSSHDQTSEQMQHLFPNQFVVDSQSVLSCLSAGGQSDTISPGQWCAQSQDGSEIPRDISLKTNVQGEFRQRIIGRDDSQKNDVSLDVSIGDQSVATQPERPSNLSGSVSKSNNLSSDKQFRNQQRWLLFLRHARRCSAPEGECVDRNCITAQNLLKHMEICNVFECLYPRCRATKVLIDHHRHCRDESCPVCIPVKGFVAAQMKAYARPEFSSSLVNSVDRSCKPLNTVEVASRQSLTTSPVVVESPEDLEPSLKRLKIERYTQVFVSEPERSMAQNHAVGESHVLQETQLAEQHLSAGMPVKSELMKAKIEFPDSVAQGSPKTIQIEKDDMDDNYLQKPDSDPCTARSPAGFAEQEGFKVEKEAGEFKLENTLATSENASGSKSGKPKVKGVSLIELFTPEQVREHIRGLRQWVGQSKSKAEKNQAMEHSMSENSCQLCAVEKLTFEPPPIYCSPCGARIKRNAMFYTIGAGEARHYFCIPCYNEARGDTILVDGTTLPKARLEKKKNDEETEEWWVQCDKCEAWQHQICALFNGRRNDGGSAEYTCPNCYIEEVEKGERKPLPQSAVLGAKDLPRTILSDHIEQRLARKLKQERQDRARSQGKNYDEVPGAEGLVVRVVSSVDKKLEVKPRFLEIFKEENYSPEYPYKSKVLLLFQKIEGVEVCLFGMYLQEFGSECQQPNNRRVYLSYLDSVKYFRPEVKTVTGEALRTYVYHEILIGYLEYCKLRGFTSCYIWACPPLKGEDYILYCHPEIQKTPKSDKLREWYLSMLKKAVREKVVVDLTNLYDHFFMSTGECKAKVTAARLPYFEGDYWPGAAEDMIYQLQQEEDGKKQHKKGTFKKSINKRALKASGQIDLSSNASKDLILMRKLGETISPMKEDFIMVHLQHGCTHCCILMVSGNSWVCSICKNFQLCDKCYGVEQNLDDRERHPINHKEKHLLYPVEINGVPVDTKDKDEILESEFFDTRQAFLSLCQGNHYQYDTLRRAKHSSMMVLYHLHNPTAPAFVTACSKCHLDIEAGQGWRCETCPEYEICNACYQKDGDSDHPHKLINHPSAADANAQNKEARQLRVLQLRKMLDLLVHASQCRSLACQYPNCRKVKGLFRHGMHCKTRAARGCVLCKKMWYLLQLHARACKESQCHVPRCRDLNEHLRRLQQQSESRRRAAVNEMMRQRAAEVAGNSG